MKKIIIAIDYAPSAQKIVEQGYEIGKALNAEIILMHIIDDVISYSPPLYDPIMGFTGFAETDYFGSDAMNILKVEANNFLEKTTLHLQDNNIKTLAIIGDVADTILKTAKLEKVNLIVIGTHSINFLEDENNSQNTKS